MKRTKLWLVMIVLSVIMLLASSSHAAAPPFINYQGMLADSLGYPLDTTVGMTFTIYDAASGGNTVWFETQTSVEIAGGQFQVLLGSENGLLDTAVFGDTARWLGVKIGDDAEIWPRSQLVSTPYSFRVNTVDGASGGDVYGDLQLHSTLTLGDNTGDPGRLEITDGGNTVITADGVGGNVGIGINPWPGKRLNVDITGTADTSAIRARNSAGTAAMFYSGSSGGYPGTPTAVYGASDGTGWGGFFPAFGDGHGLVGQSHGTGHALWSWALGTGYSGYFQGGQGVKVNGDLEATGSFKLPTGATDGHVLTSDAAGIGTWQEATGTGTSNWTVTDSVLYTNSYWGIARGGAGNVLLGDSAHTMVNLGVACTTGVSYDNYRYYMTVGGGKTNTAGQSFSTIGGGKQNMTTGSGVYSTIGGGSNNFTRGPYTTVGGGQWNDAGNQGATVGGGTYNHATGDYSIVAGGSQNLALADSSTIGGGVGNTAWGAGSTIGGGTDNAIANSMSDWATISGGSSNITDGTYSTIGGGLSNAANDSNATISGGSSNTADGNHSTIGGGNLNAASGRYSTIGGGYANAASGQTSTVAGGDSNTAVGSYSTVGGGYLNVASGSLSTVAGGYSNTASGLGASVGGGLYNSATGDSSTISGGYANHTSGPWAMIPGGRENIASMYSFAAGWRAQAVHPGSFVWADHYVSWGPAFATTADDQFLIRANGGVGIGTNSPTEALDVDGIIRSSTGFKFPDETIQTTAGVNFTLPFNDTVFAYNSAFSVTNTSSDVAIYCETTGNFGTSLYSKAAPFGRAAKFEGNVAILSTSDQSIILELGEGLDYAEGFDVSDQSEIEPGSVMIIDPDSPGELTVSNTSYDTRVAGIVAGAKGLGSGVRLGVDKFDYDVALAGRVYCKVDASYGAIQPGDLLTTSPTAGHAMVVKDYGRAQGAILGKAMQAMSHGERGEILVLVTLQ